MHDLFFEAIDQLLNSLSESQYVNKLYFIQTRLKELKQRTFQAKKYGNDLEDLQYTELFKEFLTIEADYLKETQHLQQITFEQPASKRLSLPLQKTFGFKGNYEALRKVLNSLNNKIHLLNESKNNVEDLYQFLITEDYTKFNKHIYFGCQNPQLWYIIKNLQPYFRDLSYANLGRSEILYSKGGSKLTAANFTSSKNEYPAAKELIDKALENLHFS